MQYLGEHLLPGRLGHFFAILCFAASYVALISFFKATQAKSPDEQNGWRRMGRIAYLINVFAVVAVVATIFFIVSNHLFEYNFAWEHSSKTLKFQYILACIWEAQEGSFLLWTIWVCVLGTILMRTAGKWETPVMTVMSFTQFCLATMIMGIYLFGNKIGLNPFLLVRQTEMGMRAPIFSQPDYLSIPQMQDGQGLNALLQNYWMVIHPPVLFLGFSSTVVPFAYAIAGLWKRDFGGWTRVALPWTLFSACVLGTGVMMGAAWAYEALSFGGYWAWDPVENASMVPWLVMIAGLHTQVIYNATGHSLRATYFFLITQFILVLYSTFLTRSGILGDLSVHAFVSAGMNVQLSLFLFVFLVPAYVLFISRYRNIPHIVKEEATDSREFWMFIGSLILFLSALYVIVSTSLPVINLVKEQKVAIDDAAFSYNRIEIFIAILVGILTAFVQYLRYKSTGKGVLLKKLWLPTTIALVVSLSISLFAGIHYDKYGAGFLAAIHIAIFAAVYAVVANIGYIGTGLRWNWKSAGGSVAHIGFGLMLVGILISSAKKQVLSYNAEGVRFANADPKQDPLENISLVKGVRIDMNKYWATYLGDDSLDLRSQTRYYHIRFEDKHSDHAFDLYPNMIKNTKGMEGGNPNPDKYHYWNRDIFMYITGFSPHDEQNDTAQFKAQALNLKDTAFYSRGYMILDTVIRNPNNGKYHFGPNDTALMAKVTVVSRDTMRYTASPVIYIKDNQPHFLNDTIFAQDLALRFNKITNDQKIELGTKESSDMSPFIAAKVLEFPQINILWFGTIVMIIGFVMSLLWRRRQARVKMEVR
jgi:cytochrome c-type biogenesis protein CcmF